MASSTIMVAEKEEQFLSALVEMGMLLKTK